MSKEVLTAYILGFAGGFFYFGIIGLFFGIKERLKNDK